MAKKDQGLEPTRPVDDAPAADPREDIRNGNVDLGPGVTTATPAKDDEVAYVVGDASHEDSPVRTSRPDVPIAASLAAGAGQHQVSDPAVFDRDGRYIGPVDVADNTGG